ncbi:hypothetical protein I0P70_09585 [Pontibacter sp. FD36]|uniref:hypothetical protein n=1 Tax=Pontibacter sp. FD36 TaxID=2789860 RepID=UPI0018A8AE3D|nr:hypothetical protein [Pontibacter sp. FD36]MBF8963498.1 hypothetical protein [Pontibacter sp. FD36]
MSLIKKLRLNEEYVFSGTAQDLEQFLLSSKEPQVRKIGRQLYSLTPCFSMGTLVVTGMTRQATGISVTASVAEINKDYQQVQFKTTPRIEHFFIGIIFLIITVIVIVQGESLWFYLFLPGLWVVAHLWFHTIYRAQEEEVVDMIVRRLRLI